MPSNGTRGPAARPVTLRRSRHVAPTGPSTAHPAFVRSIRATAVLLAAVSVLWIPSATAAQEGVGVAAEAGRGQPTGWLPTDPASAVEYFRGRERALELYDHERWSEAEALLGDLVRTWPGDAELWFLLARARHRLGRAERAIDAYRSTLDRGYRYHAWITYQVARLFPGTKLPPAAGRDSALGWLERALEAGWGDRPDIASDSAFVGLRGDPRFRELIGASGDAEPSRAEGWRRDLEYLDREARRLHVSPGRPAVPPAFDSAMAALRRRVPELSDDQMLLELQKLMTVLGDGHSGIYGPEPDTPLHFEGESLPVLFHRFEDGLFVVDARGEARRWIGSRVVRFGSLPAARVLEALPDYVHHDNAMTVRWLGDRFQLPRLAFLHDVGAADDLRRARLTLVTPDGATREVELPGGDHLRAFRRKLRPPPGFDGEPPRFLRRVDTNYWMERLPARQAVYLQFNQVRDLEDGPTIVAFADSVRRVLEVSESTSLIVDVRHNNGGNNGLLRPLVRTLIWWEQQADDHRIFVITGRNTFSASQNFVNRVERWTDAVFVGEPSASRPNFTGEETSLVLPYSRLAGSISNRHWQDSDPDDRRAWIAPDVPVGLTSEAYFEGRDPALEAIFQVISSARRGSERRSRAR